MNPYLYNPAFAGIDGAPVVYFLYRNQWTGFEGAPQVTNASFHMPVRSNLGIGANFFNDQIGPLGTSGGKFTFAYSAALSDEQFIRFGISAGIINSRLDPTGLDLNDPAIINALDNRFLWDGDFGFSYHFKDFTFAAAMPRIFENRLASESSLEDVRLDPTSKLIASLSYKIKMGRDQDFALEPMALYRYNEIGVDQWEAAAIFHLKNVMWFGASYRQNYGVNGLIGFKVKDLFAVGYSYEIIQSELSAFSNGSHEVQVGFLLQKPKSEVVQHASFIGEKPRRASSSGSLAARLQKQREQKAREEEAKRKAEEERKERDRLAKEEEERKRREADERTRLEAEERRKREEAEAQKAKSQQQLEEERLAREEQERLAREEEERRKQQEAERLAKEEADRQRREEEQRALSEAEKERLAREEARRLLSISKPPRERMQRGTHELELQSGFYVVVGAFTSEANANRFSDQQLENGYLTQVGYNSGKKLYYVYIHDDQTLQGANRQRNRFKQVPDFKDAWILEIE